MTNRPDRNARNKDEAKLAAMKKAKQAAGGAAADEPPPVPTNAPSSPGAVVALDGDFMNPGENKFKYDELIVVGVVPPGVSDPCQLLLTNRPTPTERAWCCYLLSWMAVPALIDFAAFGSIW